MNTVKINIQKWGCCFLCFLLMGTLSYTDERAENMLFSELPMGEEKFLIETMLKYWGYASQNGVLFCLSDSP